MPPYILWGHNQRAEFHSFEELAPLIEQLKAQAAREGVPIGIQVRLTPETGLALSVGREESHLEFYSTVVRGNYISLIPLAKSPVGTSVAEATFHIQWANYIRPSLRIRQQNQLSRYDRMVVRKYIISEASV